MGRALLYFLLERTTSPWNINAQDDLAPKRSQAMAPSDLRPQRTTSQKILCGIDGSDRSARAAGVATQLAQKLDAELTFAMVNPRLAARAAILYVWPDTYIAGILEKAVRKALWQGVPSVRCETWRAETVSDALAD